jgi:hypothetical protein
MATLILFLLCWAAVVSLAAAFLSACAGSAHVCAVSDLGSARCWGANEAGQLGLGDRRQRGSSPGDVPPPVVPLPEAATSVACGSNFTCALGASGAVYCWGANDRGQLGIGANVSSSPLTGLPVHLDGLSGSLCAGTAFACSAERADPGKVQCWGANDVGQLCSGDARDRGRDPTDFPLPVVISGAREVACGGGHAHATLATREIVGWGDNGLGQLALGTIVPPYAVVGTAPGSVPVSPVLGPQKVAGIALGARHSCFAFDDGSIACSGSNDLGQLGYPGVALVGATIESVPPPPVDVGFAVTHLSAFASHTCATGYYPGTPPPRSGAAGTNATACWGANDVGQLGIGTEEAGVGLANGTMPPSAEDATPASARLGFVGGSSCARTTLIVLGASSVRGNATLSHIVTRHVLVGWGSASSGQLLAGGPLPQPQLTASALNVECGDNVVDGLAGEECDLGTPTDGQSCSPFCRSAPCSDAAPCEPCYLSELAELIAEDAGCTLVTTQCLPPPPVDGAVCGGGEWTTQGLVNVAELVLSSVLVVRGNYTQLTNATLRLGEGAYVSAATLATVAGSLVLDGEPLPNLTTTAVVAWSVIGAFASVVSLADTKVCSEQIVLPGREGTRIVSVLLIGPEECNGSPSRRTTWIVLGVLGAVLLVAIVAYLSLGSGVWRKCVRAIRPHDGYDDV